MFSFVLKDFTVGGWCGLETGNFYKTISWLKRWEMYRFPFSKWLFNEPRFLLFNLRAAQLRAYYVLKYDDFYYDDQFSSVVSDSMRLHGVQHARPPCPSPTLGVYSNSCPLSQWCHPAISSSVIPFSSCPQSFPASGSFQMSQFFASDGQSIGVSASASVLPINVYDWFPLGGTGWISLLSKGL